MSITDGVLVETVKEEDIKSDIHESLYSREESTGPLPRRRFIKESTGLPPRIKFINEDDAMMNLLH